MFVFFLTHTKAGDVCLRGSAGPAELQHEPAAGFFGWLASLSKA